MEVPFIISHFDQHDLLKDKVLSSIDKMPETSISYTTGHISKCDWQLPRDYPRKYLDVLEEPIYTFVKKQFAKLGYSDVSITNVWFQQYNKNSSHGWHEHLECQWTNVYYLQFPEETPKTQYLNRLSGEIHTFDVKEGDILIFPSFITHCAPKNESDKTKTIISFNSNVRS